MQHETIILDIPEQDLLPADIPIGEIYGRGVKGEKFYFIINKKWGNNNYPTSWAGNRAQDLIFAAAGSEFVRIDDQEIAAHLMARQVHYDQEYDTETGELRLTYVHDLIDRHADARVHNAPAFAMLDGMMAHWDNMDAVLDKIKDALVAAQTGFDSAARGNQAGIESAARNMDTALRECQKIDLGKGKEWLQCSIMVYDLHTIVAGQRQGRHNNPLTHACAASVAWAVAPLYFKRVLKPVGEHGQKREDTQWIDNGLLEMIPRLPTENESHQRQKAINTVVDAFAMVWEWEPEFFDGQGKLTRAGEERVREIVMSVDPTRPPLPPPPPPVEESPPPTVQTPEVQTAAPAEEEAPPPPPPPDDDEEETPPPDDTPPPETREELHARQERERLATLTPEQREAYDESQRRQSERGRS